MTGEEVSQGDDALRRRLEEAEETLRAISRHEVDAFLVRQGLDEQVLVLGGVDRPYRLLIERMQQGALTLAADGTILFANRRFAELLGIVPGELPGTSFLDCFSDADRPAADGLLRQGAALDAALESTLERGDGTFVPVHVTASPLLEQEGLLCVIVTDLTQRQRHERERERFIQEQAARTAAESTAAILREASQRKDEFLATLAHELRSPLAPLQTGIEILNHTSSREPGPQATRDMMKRQIESLVRLVDDLLDVARLTQGKIKLQKERADLKDVVLRAVESCRPVIDERGHQLEISIPPDPLPVEADVIRISQVVINLLNNAVKFTPPPGTITLLLERAGGEAVIRVRDNGIGIAPEMLPRLFELFVQADSTGSHPEGGLGIGLTLSRKMAELHGGSLAGTSAGVKQGSEFTLRLPLLQAAAGPVPGRTRPVAAIQEKTASRRVLIVDDSRDSAESLSHLLRILGHETRQVFDGEAALDVAPQYAPDLVLLDIGLPGVSGFEVARRLRAQAGLRATWIVALSGFGSDEDRRRSSAAGFHRHLVKPLDLAALEALLASLGTPPDPGLRAVERGT